jgi:hypothetical protein
VLLGVAAAMGKVAEQGEGFAAYCRKGKGRKRLEMEDRHVAAVALGLQHRTSHKQPLAPSC